MGLKGYKKKRDFSKSGEPSSSKGGRNIFVIQKHAASHLHYDLRLKIGRTLYSWAVPKAPSMSTKVRRLAIETQEHPLSYANFEGVIPEGNYGAGVVMIWDRGTFSNCKKVSLKKCYDEGQIEFFLKGKKLYGKFVLIHTGEKKWLLIKMKDEYANRKLSLNGQSAKTGRKMKQIQDARKK